MTDLYPRHGVRPLSFHCRSASKDDKAQIQGTRSQGGKSTCCTRQRHYLTAPSVREKSSGTWKEATAKVSPLLATGPESEQRTPVLHCNPEKSQKC